MQPQPLGCHPTANAPHTDWKPLELGLQAYKSGCHHGPRDSQAWLDAVNTSPGFASGRCACEENVGSVYNEPFIQLYYFCYYYHFYYYFYYYYFYYYHYYYYFYYYYLYYSSCFYYYYYYFYYYYYY
nr:unnamed protein product [Spirometra erinaceieuropaei]